MAAATPEAISRDYAGFWMRFGAWAIDSVIILFGFGVIEVVSFAVSFLGLFFGYLGFFVEGFLGLAEWVLPLLYLVLMTGLKGQTLGKMAVGIRVVRADGHVPGLGYGALREIVGKAVSAIALFLGFLWIAWDPKKQGWHDKIAGTQVIKTRG